MTVFQIVTPLPCYQIFLCSSAGVERSEYNEPLFQQKTVLWLDAKNTKLPNEVIKMENWAI